MKSKYFISIIVFGLFLIDLSGNPKQDRSTSMGLNDFDIVITDEKISIGDDIFEVSDTLERCYGTLYGPVKIERNDIEYKVDEVISIRYIDGFPILYAMIIDSSEIATARGISVGDSIQDIYNAYNVESLQSYQRDDYLVIQQIFYRSDNLPDDNILTYDEEPNKTYSITFLFDEKKVVRRITINQAFDL